MAKSLRPPLLLIVLLFVSGLIAWADRVNLSVAAPILMREFGWDAAVMGWVLSAFGWGYLLAQLWTGWLCDRWGGVRTLVTALTGWSVATLLTIVPRTPAFMALVRGVLGVFESAYGPALAATVTRSFPSHQIGRALSFCISATALGPLLALPAATSLTVAYGWRAPFLLFGSAGLFWAGLIVLYARFLWRVPKGAIAEEGAVRNVPFTGLIRLTPVWGLGLAYLSQTYTWYFIANWMPTYLIQARGFNLWESGLYTALPFLCAFLFEAGAGWVNHGLQSLGWSPSMTRKSIVSFGSTGAAILLLWAGFTPSPLWAVVALSLALGLVGGNIATLWILATDIAPKNVGAVTGIMSFMGSFGAILAPAVTGLLVARTGRWGSALLLTAAVNAFALVAIGWLVSLRPLLVLDRALVTHPALSSNSAPLVGEDGEGSGIL
ncbi:Hexuronate transporter [bacterium HR10]|nr:Hexuronate transporter [bacterium HR10]